MKDIVHGEVVRISDRVRRITAPNAGHMTGPGTNTYLVGDKSVAVVDPGPSDQRHIDAILDCCADQVRWILVTHTHRDHSPAAQILAEATGATVMGNSLPHNDGFQDASFSSQRFFVHHDHLTTDEFTIRVLLTPGHVDNHVCYLVEQDQLLMTGDHIMQGSSVVIIPPHGDMKKYLDSLQLLLDQPMAALAPGHGHVIDDPQSTIQRIIDHRLWREAKVISALSHQHGYTLENLVPIVYEDVPPGVYPIAAHSLLAHLLKLEQEKRVTKNSGQWSLLV